MRTLFSTLLLTGFVNAAGWNYLKHGSDWAPGKCTGDVTNQTPIDLISPSNKAFQYPLINGTKDARSYKNLYDATVAWNGHTSQTSTLVQLRPKQTSFFTSNLAKEYLGADAGPTTYEAQQFHFHSPSEHTFDGQYHDLEMHTVHYPKEKDSSGYIAAALGIMFSVDKHNAVLSTAERAVIDTFFDSLQWDVLDGTPVVSDIVAYGNLVNIVDFDNRWIYQGSVTTPPCAQKVFWNELSTIYPIKQSTLDNFRKQLDRPHFDAAAGKTNAEVYKGTSQSAVGNYREIQKIDNHNVKYVSNPDTAQEPATKKLGEKPAEDVVSDKEALETVILVLLVITLLVVLGICYMTAKNMMAGSKSATLAAEGGFLEVNVPQVLHSADSNRALTKEK